MMSNRDGALEVCCKQVVQQLKLNTHPPPPGVMKDSTALSHTTSSTVLAHATAYENMATADDQNAARAAVAQNDN